MSTGNYDTNHIYKPLPQAYLKPEEKAKELDANIERLKPNSNEPKTEKPMEDLYSLSSGPVREALLNNSGVNVNAPLGVFDNSPAVQGASSDKEIPGVGLFAGGADSVKQAPQNLEATIAEVNKAAENMFSLFEGYFANFKEETEINALWQFNDYDSLGENFFQQTVNENVDLG